MSDSYDHPITSLSRLLSPHELDLLVATGENLIETIGIDVIRGVVLDVLTGRNIRSSTESLTRRRIATLNLALLNMFIQGTVKQHDFIEQLPFIASEILSQKNDKAEKWLAHWAMGLTGKGMQNILRDDVNLIPEYRDIYIKTCQDIIEDAKRTYGNLSGTLALDTGIQVKVNWLFMLYLLNMVGSQTLTIRGSEKSLYGKFFEKLVLGSLLHILGFKQVPAGTLDKPEQVFWLSSSSEHKRESDATMLFAPGQGVRMDIGFIGRGNTEISLDKVARYRREIELGSTHYFMGTIIVVDRVGPRSRIIQLAEEIDGTIVQMSAGYWPQRIARELNAIFGYDHPLVTMVQDDVGDYLQTALQDVPLMNFIRLASDS
jgi:hypothetical protein